MHRNQVERLCWDRDALAWRTSALGRWSSCLAQDAWPAAATDTPGERRSAAVSASVRTRHSPNLHANEAAVATGMPITNVSEVLACGRFGPSAESVRETYLVEFVGTGHAFAFVGPAGSPRRVTVSRVTVSRACFSHRCGRRASVAAPRRTASGRRIVGQRARRERGVGPVASVIADEEPPVVLRQSA